MGTGEIFVLGLGATKNGRKKRKKFTHKNTHTHTHTHTRGQNQPVINTLTKECYITPQNHGFEVASDTLPSNFKALFTNANDGSNEGVVHTSRPYFSAQFHPEAHCGPTDTEFLFDTFLDACRSKMTGPLTKKMLTRPLKKSAPPRPVVKKVLMLGSGGTSIGQAGEFDYSGAQAIKALKEENLEVVLMVSEERSTVTNHCY